MPSKDSLGDFQAILKLSPRSVQGRLREGRKAPPKVPREALFVLVVCIFVFVFVLVVGLFSVCVFVDCLVIRLRVPSVFVFVSV